MKTVAVAGTFDTKAEEFQYVISLLEKKGIRAYTIHTGVFEPKFKPDVSNAEIAERAGTDIVRLAAGRDRALATETLSRGMELLLPELYQKGKFDGILSMGGSGGTSLVTPAMRALPLGVPKVMVSTMASGNVEQYVGTSDIVMMPSIVDVAGLNEISTMVFSNAVNAVAGMVNGEKAEEKEKKPLVAATMFGVTTPCVDAAKAYLEDRGYEVLVFHATGTGGKAMETLVRNGFIQGVLDMTTTELCDELVGGVLSAGPNRLTAAGEKKIPQVVSVGAMDMVNFGPPDTVPSKFSDRKFYQHNPTVTLMRTTEKENRELGKILAEKLNRAEGKTAVYLPLKGVSGIDTKDAPFYGEKEDKALFDAIRKNIAPTVEITELDLDINDPKFAEAAAQKLIDYMEN